MPLLVILKRFEVWLLITVVFALLAFAFRPGPEVLSPAGAGETTTMTVSGPAQGKTDPKAPAPAEPEKSFAVDEVTVTPSKGGLIVELTLTGRSPSGRELTLDDSNVTATTGEGEPVNRFFEPFREPAVLLASGDSVATLKWWLERPADIIWLDLQGERVKAELP